MSSKRVLRFVGQYKRQSFDRFGDDLTELILSFLPFEDKIRLQSVAKQWNRLILNKQMVLNISEDKNNVIDNVRQLLATVNRYVLHGVQRREKKIDIKRLMILLKKCPNIRRIDFHETYIVDSVLKAITDFCPRLESLSIGLSSVSEEVLTRFGQRIGQRIRSIEFFDLMINDNQNRLITLCPNIESLKMTFFFGISSQTFKDLPLIQNLKTLSLKLRDFEENIFEDIDKWVPNLISLEIIDWSTIRLGPTPKPIPSLKNLRHICLSFAEGITDQTLYSLPQLKSLTHLSIKGYNNSVTDSGVCRLIDNCPQIKVINFDFKPNITLITINKLIEMANKRPKEKLIFSSLGSESGLNFTSILNEPKNLKIIDKSMNE